MATDFYRIGWGPPPPMVIAMQDEFMRRMRAEDELVEFRIILFMERTGLKIEDLILVQMPSGNRYPQWKGAAMREVRCPED